MLFLLFSFVTPRDVQGLLMAVHSGIISKNYPWLWPHMRDHSGTMCHVWGGEGPGLPNLLTLQCTGAGGKRDFHGPHPHLSTLTGSEESWQSKHRSGSGVGQGFLDATIKQWPWLSLYPHILPWLLGLPSCPEESVPRWPALLLSSKSFSLILTVRHHKLNDRANWEAPSSPLPAVLTSVLSPFPQHFSPV